jgi:hypothetical protein
MSYDRDSDIFPFSAAGFMHIVPYITNVIFVHDGRDYFENE